MLEGYRIAGRALLKPSTLIGLAFLILTCPHIDAFPVTNYFRGQKNPPIEESRHVHLYRRRLDRTLSDSNELASTISVSYEGQTCEINVFPEESILAALERQSLHLKSHLTALQEMPSDCRRGNCLTCAAYCSKAQPALIVRDGLSPTISKLVAEKGFVLTCSSFVTTSGLELQLGTNHQLWKEVYSSPGRFTTSDAQLAARSAMARVIRQSAERNVDAWARETEEVLRSTKDQMMGIEELNE